MTSEEELWPDSSGDSFSLAGTHDRIKNGGAPSREYKSMTEPVPSSNLGQRSDRVISCR